MPQITQIWKGPTTNLTDEEWKISDAAKSLTSAADIDVLVGRILLSSRCYAPKPKGQED
jgi:hypothetical protein